MTSKFWKWPTKGQAVYLGILALLLLVSNWVAVMYEGLTATGLYWAVQSVGIVLLVICIWAYVRAAKRSSKPTP